MKSVGLPGLEARAPRSRGCSPAAGPASRSAGRSATRPRPRPGPARPRSREVTAAATRNRTRPGVRDQRGQLRPAVAVAVEVGGRRRPPRARTANRWRRRTRGRGIGVHARHERPVRQLRVEEGVGLDDADVGATARHSRGVRSMVQATIERIRTTSPTLNQAEREDLEQLQPLERVDHVRRRASGRRGRGACPSRSRSPSASGRRSPGSWRRVMPTTASRARTMIWRTAKSTEVSRPQTASREAAGPGRGGRGRRRRGSRGEVGGARRRDARSARIARVEGPGRGRSSVTGAMLHRRRRRARMPAAGARSPLSGCRTGSVCFTRRR